MEYCFTELIHEKEILWNASHPDHKSLSKDSGNQYKLVS